MGSVDGSKLARMLLEVQLRGPHPCINLLHVSEERHNLHPNKCAGRLLSLQNGRHSIREEKQGFTWEDMSIQ